MTQMNSQSTEPRVVSKYRMRWMVTALLVLAAGLYLSLLHNQLGDIVTDSHLYLVLAKALATGHGFRDIHLPGQPPEITVPFLFPLLLSVVMRITPTALWPLHLLVVVHLWLALWCGWRWLRHSDGTWLGVLALGCTILNPRIAEWSLVLVPIFPYLGYSLAAFLAVRRYVASPRVLDRWYWATLSCVLAATFLWLPGLVLCAAAVMAVLTSGEDSLRWRKARLLALGCALPIGAWCLRGLWVQHEQANTLLQPFYAISGSTTYWRTMAYETWFDPASPWVGWRMLGQRCVEGALFYGETIARYLYIGTIVPIGWALVAAAVIGWGARCRRGITMAEWSVVGYLALQALNPFRLERYVLPVLPLCYAYALWGIHASLRAIRGLTAAQAWWPRWQMRWLGRALGVGVLVIVLTPAIEEVVWRVRVHHTPLRLPGQTTTVNWAQFLERRYWAVHPDQLLAINDFFELHAWVRTHDPSRAVIFSTMPRLSAWLSSHEALRFPMKAREDGLLRMADRVGARYVITTEANVLMELYHRPPVQEFLGRCELIQRRPFGALYRVVRH